jgi:transcriptional regulator GlxA family with amidase domain
MHVTILVPGFGYPSPVIGPYEVFTSAGYFWNTLRGEAVDRPFQVIKASQDGNSVVFDGGFTVEADKAFSQVRKTDLIFVPSIGLDIEKALQSNPGIMRFLQRHHKKGTTIAGVCTGVAVLAEAGLLSGRPATTHWALADEYRLRYPDVDWRPGQFVTQDENILCGGGVYAALDLCLCLVEQFAGYEIARQTARSLLIDPPRTWQASFSTPVLNRRHSDDKVLAAQDYLHEHFRDQFTMDHLARQIGMSPRNFARRFKNATGKTALTYLHDLRINCARQILETNHESIQETCFQVGYRDVPFFRRVFKRYMGLSPKEYRHRFAVDRNSKRY